MTEIGKGKPTPKRKDAEAARNRRRLAPASSKEARKEAREQARIERMASRAAYLRGEEKAMPARDRGVARRMARDIVDARTSIGEFFLPVVLLVLLLSSFAALRVFMTLFMYLMLLAAIVDGSLLVRRAKKAISNKFPDAEMKGISLYIWLRATQLRRLRTPPAQVQRGTKVI